MKIKFLLVIPTKDSIQIKGSTRLPSPETREEVGISHVIDIQHLKSSSHLEFGMDSIPITEIEPVF
jgi:hypothetical protein